MDALAPHISAETLEFHYGKHHNAYVTELNRLVEADASLRGKSLEEIITAGSGGVSEQAAQVWNHTFYWHSMGPGDGGEPTGKLADAIRQSFGGFAQFREQFSNAAAGHFASGWVWLARRKDLRLVIVDTHDAGTLAVDAERKPLLTCDVWEHAYYLDYRNARPEYVKAWWNLVNWKFAGQNLA
jgi:Fe-Mn family superoxide dismutase